MIRYLKLGFLAALAILLVTIAMANRQVVTLQVLPDLLGEFLGRNLVLTLPLFVVVFGGVITGLAIGFVLEWLREGRIRADAGRAKRENARLNRENKRLKSRTGQSKDDVLALLEDGSTPG